MTERRRYPYGEHRDGLGDPQRLSADRRARSTEERVREQHESRTSLSPVLRRLQVATNRALGGR